MVLGVWIPRVLTLYIDNRNVVLENANKPLQYLESVGCVKCGGGDVRRAWVGYPGGPGHNIATVIYPFINQFVRDTGVTRGDERKTGYYAGVILGLPDRRLGCLRRFGSCKIQVFGHFNYCVVLALYPILSFFVRRAGGADGFVWAIVTVVVQLTFTLSNSVAYTSILTSLMDSAPSRSSLSTVNGLVQAIGSVMRGLAPTVASSLFSVSLEKKLAGGNLVFMILFMISAIGLRMTFLMPK
ncbi:hypothetical protein DXG01_007554 [Tephrocybe rancida]|nr:hypothetical protein DXG01_007554 [Tephrocybe rancida]